MNLASQPPGGKASPFEGAGEPSRFRVPISGGQSAAAS